MIPIGDNVPTRTFPFVTITLILLNIAIFIYELTLGNGVRGFIGTHGVIPKDVTSAVMAMDLSGLSDKFLSSLFIHSGWLHLGGNMLYLWIFGNNVEDRLGHTKYLAFYVAVGFIAMGIYVASMPASVAPAIGASGAVAGILGAYLVMFSRARVFIVIPLFLFFPVVAIRAIYVLGFWFVEQLINGAGAIVEPTSAAGVAWWAHIGGFAAGMIIASIFIRKGTPIVRWR